MPQKRKRPCSGVLGLTGLMALFACLVLPPVASALPAAQTPPAATPPSADSRFSEDDAAVRINRGAVLKDEGNDTAAAAGQAQEGGSGPTLVIGIGNIIAPNRAAGSIVNQTEIRNSTVIIQTR